MENEEIYQEARKKVRAKKGFFYHFAAYVGVLAMLYAIMYFEDEGNLLPVIIVGLSWGIGVAAHYLKAFGTQHLDFLGISPNWEEESLQEEIEKIKKRKALAERMSQENSREDELDSLELKEIEKELIDRKRRSDSSE